MDPVLFNTLNGVGIGVLLVWELRSPLFRKLFRDGKRMRRNLAFLASSLGVAWLLHWGALLMPALAPGGWAWQAPLFVQLPLVFLLGELLNWLLHRAKHEYNFLWRFHCQHHKEDHYSVWITAHTYAPEVLISGLLISATVVGCGFSKLALDCYLLFYSIVNLYQHSALPHSLGILDKLIVNPAYHRHHHSGEQVNFGSTLTVWDYVFGTRKRPVSRHEAVNPPSVEETREPFGFVAEMLYPLKPSRWIDTRALAPKR